MDNSVYYNHELNVYVKIDAVKSVTPSPDGEAWIFEGIASTADMDLYNEVVYPESFINSIDFFKNNGKIFFDHDYAKSNADWLSNHGFSRDEILALRTPIGKPLDAKITDEGLYIRAVLNKSHPMARLMWNQFLNNEDESFRDQLGLSIGAKYLGQPRKEYDVKKGKYVTYLPDLLLYEVSLTPEPVNPHTKSWKAAIKSMMEEAEIPREKETQYHRIKPDSIQFDDVNNQIVVKSTVVDSDGVNHVFEQVIDVKEDVIKSMEDTNQAMKNVVDSVEKAAIVGGTMKQVPPQGAPMMPQQPPAPGAAPGMAPGAAPGMAPGAAPGMAPGAAPGGAPEMEGGPGEGEMPTEEGGDEEGASSVLEALASQSDEAAGEGEGEEGESTSLILDKIDALTDLVSQLMDRMDSSQTSQEAPAQDQVSTDVPQLKSIIREAVSEEMLAINEIQNLNTQKSIDISEESALMLAETIKSIVYGMEDNIIQRVTEAVLNETLTSIKSISEKTAREKSPIIHPGAIADANPQEQDVDMQVMKSVTNAPKNELAPQQMDTLKSMLTEYNGILGYTGDKSQQRAKVIERAQDELGIHPSIFKVYANKAHKGKL
jgi:hypothetical protein